MPLYIRDAAGTILSIIVPLDEPIAAGITFHTSDSEQLQIAGMRHPAGRVIANHTHNHAPRTIDRTHEALFVRKGRVCARIFDEQRQLVGEYMLSAGDVILLLAGGHGFVVAEEAEMVEVKQGPFLGDWEKTRF